MGINRRLELGTLTDTKKKVSLVFDKKRNELVLNNYEDTRDTYGWPEDLPRKTRFTKNSPIQLVSNRDLRRLADTVQQVNYVLSLLHDDNAYHAFSLTKFQLKLIKEAKEKMLAQTFTRLAIKSGLVMKH